MGQAVKKNYLILIWLVIILCVGGLFIARSEIFFDDEVITYSMANSETGGFIFSAGRVGKYLDEYIISESLPQTVRNLFGVIPDVLVNRQNAAFFRMDPPDESGWFTGDGFRSVFAVGRGERFDYLNVLKNSLSEEVNPFLYYALVHTASSFFPEASGYSKWAAGIVNLIFLAGIVFAAYRGMLRLGTDRVRAAVMAAFVSSASGLVARAPYCRAYVSSNFFILVIGLLHVFIYRDMKNGEDRQLGRDLLGVSAAVIFGFYSHYSTTVYAGCTFIIFVILCFCRKFPGRTIFRYVKYFVISGIICVCTWPVSVFGMLKKFLLDKAVESESRLSKLMRMPRLMLSFVNFYRIVSIIILILAVLAVIILLLKKSKSSSTGKCALFLLCSAMFSGVVITVFLDIRYTVMLTAVLAASLAMLISVCPKEKIVTAVMAVLVLLNLAVLIKTAFGIRTDSYYFYKGLAEKYENETVLYVRHYKANYELTPMLSHFEKILVITKPNVELEAYADDEGLQRDRLVVCVYNDKEAIAEVSTFLKEDLGYRDVIDLCADNEDRIVSMRVFEAVR